MEQHDNLLENDLIIDSISAGHLKETALWAKFLAIIGFIMSGLSVVGALLMGSFFSRISGFAASSTIIYIIMAAVIFFISRFLLQFARKAQAALKAADQESLTAAFKNLKIYFRYTGILAVISLIFAVLGAIAITLAASFSRY